MRRLIVLLSIVCLSGLSIHAREARADSTGTIPSDAKYACPMETHPDEADPAKRGPYFSDKPGKCPRCGMKLVPLDTLDWVRVLRAAAGGDVGYTCPDHPHVFSKTPGTCPRCGRKLEPFKVMYTCPNPEHADVISTEPGKCPRCGRALVAFRGVWLAEDMAGANVPPHPGVAETAKYHCPIHPLVHSDKPGRCTICGRPLVSNQPAPDNGQAKKIPPGAKYVCPMERCWYFSSQPGECPKCGMRLQPIDSVPWAKALSDSGPAPEAQVYLCPMHPDTVRSTKPGTCSICGMRLVPESEFHRPHDAPSVIVAQIDYITEHYLDLQRLLASDKTDDVARQALGIAAACEELLKHIEGATVANADEIKTSVEKLRDAALKTTGASLEKDRVTFVGMSSAMRELINVARPDRDRWPKLYIYHCPMSKGDWVQTTLKKANPYYGFKMLNCGELQDVK